MTPKLPGSRLEIVPLYIGSSNVKDLDVQSSNSFIPSQECVCFLEIFYQPPNRIEKQLYQDKQICYITEIPENGVINAIGLHFKSPFYVDANCLLVPTAKIGGIFMCPAIQYEVRLRFTYKNQEKWFPLSIHKLFGLDPSQWQPKANCGYGYNISLRARGYDSLTSLGTSQDKSLYQTRLEYKQSETEGHQTAKKWDFIVWDLKIHCRWTDYVPIDPSLPDHADRGSMLLAIEAGKTSSSLIAPTIKIPYSLSQSRKQIRYNTQFQAPNTKTMKRRSKRLENKVAMKRGTQNLNSD